MGKDENERLERRAWPVERLEVRAAEGSAPVIEGYAAVFNQLSADLGGFRERIEPGAFSRSLLDNDIRALWEHNSQYVIGRNRAGTLALAEDDKGLSVEVEPPDTGWARDLLKSMKRGDVNQMSFGFFVIRDEWRDEDGLVVRVLKEVDLFDVSVVTYPAYPQTSAEARRIVASGRWPVAGEDRNRQPGPAGDVAGLARTQARRAARRREIELIEAGD